MIYKCKICGKDFHPKNHQNISYCSHECQKEGNRRNSRGNNQVIKRICPVCLEEFTTCYPQKIFCCSECAAEYRDIASDVLLKRRPVIRQMLEKVASDPTIDIKELIRKEYPKI